MLFYNYDPVQYNKRALMINMLTTVLPTPASLIWRVRLSVGA